ncbi:MAG TPA: hypothetical protein PLT09_12950 [Deltaproteobacteria bacterium]|nr:hypothetical protein [Deltaproteobacteria bacterium]HPR55527.1 hypothetical protein [Deltaproteobacteria bacterium]HXK48349.1 hypothetical protein [Deltaproteobacteria bacterium]
MENKEIVKQMVDLHKTSFDNSFNMLVSLQDQMEKMVNTFVDQAPWLPAEGKKAIGNLVSTYKKGREDFRKLVDDGYRKVEDYIGKE